MRGHLTFAARTTGGLITPSVINLATDRVIRQMNITEFSDRLDTVLVAQQQALALQTGTRIRTGAIGDIETIIPDVSTMGPGRQGEIRYFAVVESVNQDTGQVLKTPVEVLSDAPLSRTQIAERAQQSVASQAVPLGPPGTAIDVGPRIVTRTVIISAQRRE